MSEKNEFLEMMKLVAIATLLIVGIRTFLFTPVAVEGASMMPTYEDGDRIIVNKTVKAFDSIERFDVIVFKPHADERYIKRIIGMPGDHVAYQNDELYINGEKLAEPYLEEYKAELKDSGDLTFDFTLEELTSASKVPEGHYFVLGDNRRKSLDSRDPSVGFVSEKQIIGESVVRIYPFKDFGLIE